MLIRGNLWNVLRRDTEPSLASIGGADEEFDCIYSYIQSGTE